MWTRRQTQSPDLRIQNFSFASDAAYSETQAPGAAKDGVSAAKAGRGCYSSIWIREVSSIDFSRDPGSIGRSEKGLSPIFGILFPVSVLDGLGRVRLNIEASLEATCME